MKRFLFSTVVFAVLAYNAFAGNLAGLPDLALRVPLVKSAVEATGLARAGADAVGSDPAPVTESTSGPVGVEVPKTMDAGSGHDSADAFKDRIYQGLTKVSGSVDVSGLGVSPEAGVTLFRQVLSEHPEIFWVDGGCSYRYDDTGLVSLSPTYLYGTSDLPQMRDAYEQRVSQALESAEGLGSEVEKAKALHDWLIQNAEYSRTGAEGGEVPMVEHTAFGIMVNGTGVCDGYARAYADLLARVGIKSVVVESEAMNHAWNLVSVGGNWYHVDVTYDDPVIKDMTGAIVADDQVRSTYFLKSDGYFQSHDHYGWTSDIQAGDTSFDGKQDWQVYRG